MSDLDNLNIIVGSNRGGEGLAFGAAKVGEWRALVVNESCVFTSFHVNGVDVMAARGLGTIEWATGMYIGAGTNPGNKITSVHLTSGSVMLY